MPCQMRIFKDLNIKHHLLFQKIVLGTKPHLTCYVGYVNQSQKSNRMLSKHSYDTVLKCVVFTDE